MASLTVTFHHGRRACNGHDGMVGHSTHQSTIDLCVSSLPEEKARSVVAHELAHTWLFHNITDGDRAAFLDVHGLKAWYSKDLKWNEQGTEWAAETIAEMLFPDLPRIIPEVARHPALLTEGFQVLSGKRHTPQR